MNLMEFDNGSLNLTEEKSHGCVAFSFFVIILFHVEKYIDK